MDWISRNEIYENVNTNTTYTKIESCRRDSIDLFNNDKMKFFLEDMLVKGNKDPRLL